MTFPLPLIRQGLAHIEYAEDTLLGPVPKSADCQVSLNSAGDRHPHRLELLVEAPLPHHLHKAHTLVIRLNDVQISATVLSYERLAGERLQLLIELQASSALTADR